MLILMWSASLPPSDDLFLDIHIIYALLLIGLAAIGAGKTLGFGERWQQIPLVQQHRWLAQPPPRPRSYERCDRGRLRAKFGGGDTVAPPSQAGVPLLRRPLPRPARADADEVTHRQERLECVGL
jgi:hypothetical protein